MHTRRLFLALLTATVLAGPALADGVVNIYSYRQPALIDPLFKAFTEKTGIEVKSVFAEKDLIERMEQEGNLSPVDLLMTADVGRLVEAKEKGLGQPVVSDVITKDIPASLRDPENQWFGLTMRARVVYASKERVKQDTISYEELADPKWKGKVCTRPGDHPYNLGLISAMIAKRGFDYTRTWLQGVKDNLATKPNGSDRSQAKSVWAGECDLAIGNTYYVGLMTNNEKEPEQKEWAKAIKVIFPSSPEMGTHVNISGMLLAKNAPNKDNAIKLMEFLSTPEAQQLYAGQNYEYPVGPGVAANETVLSWGKLTPDPLNIGEVAAHQKEAAKLVDEVQFNN